VEGLSPCYLGLLSLLSSRASHPPCDPERPVLRSFSEGGSEGSCSHPPKQIPPRCARPVAISLQVGSTLAGTTETKSDTSQGKSKTETEEVIGTGTAYKPGKEIEVLTGDNKKHSFGLDQKDTRVDIDPRVTIGTKVQLVQTKDDAGRKSISVSIQPSR